MRPWLKEARKKCGFTMKQVATAAEISECYYSQIEGGSRNCPVQTAKKIAEVLGFPWTLFFNDSTESAAPVTAESVVQ